MKNVNLFFRSSLTGDHVCGNGQARVLDLDVINLIKGKIEPLSVIVSAVNARCCNGAVRTAIYNQIDNIDDQNHG